LWEFSINAFSNSSKVLKINFQGNQQRTQPF
jgi:hypothetical protein